MSKDLEPHPRRVVSRLIVTSLRPRVNIWSPISLTEAIDDLVALDSSNLRILSPDQTDYLMPNTRDYLIDNLYSDQIPDGFSNGRFTGLEEASFVLYKGVLLTPQNNQPAETRFVIMQTSIASDEIKVAVRESKQRRINALRRGGSSKYFADADGYSGNTRLS